jgi:hypothetical protein
LPRSTSEDRTERCIATSPFFYYTVGINGVVNVFEGLGGGGWLGGGSDEGEEAWKKSKRLWLILLGMED